MWVGGCWGVLRWPLYNCLEGECNDDDDGGGPFIFLELNLRESARGFDTADPFPSS